MIMLTRVGLARLLPASAQKREREEIDLIAA